jgi:hypothetical protein
VIAREVRNRRDPEVEAEAIKATADANAQRQAALEAGEVVLTEGPQRMQRASQTVSRRRRATDADDNK